MKIKAFYIPLLILSIDLLLSLPQFNLKVIGALRLLFIPVLIFVLLDLLGKIDVRRASFAVRMSFPWLLLLLLFGFQTLFIPSSAVSIHLSGCVKFIEWTLLYLCLLFSMNAWTAQKIRTVIFGLLLLIFLATIVQYPVLIQRSSISLGALIASYGHQKAKDVFGLFAAANEDANCLMTLFPLALFYIRRFSILKRILLQAAMFLYVAVVLFFNGTRTALFMTFPFVSFLFYFRLSLRTLAGITPVILTAISFYSVYVANFAKLAFSREAQGEGTLAFRVERAWIPASTYTFENSPIWGFGSRGWEYVGSMIRIMRDAGEENAFEIIPPHNVYVWTYVSWGAIGFLCYLLFLVMLLTSSFQLSTFPHSQISYFGKALFCSSVAYCIWAGISNAQIEIGWLILLSIGIMISSLKVSAWAIRNQSITSTYAVDAQEKVGS
jgi:hypothetical protein